VSFTESLVDLVARNPNGLLSAHQTWCRVPLGLVCDVQNGFPFESRYFNSSGDGMPLLRIRDVVRGSSETYYSGEYDPAFVVKAGDIVVGMDGDFNCRVWRGVPALLNQRVCRLIPSSDCYSSALLAKVIQGYLDAINSSTSSITVKHLSSQTILEIPLPLPPLREQQGIVEAIDSCLSRVDAASAGLEGVRAKVKSYRASVLKAAVEGRLVPTEASLARADKRDYEAAEELLRHILKERRRRWEETELTRLRASGKPPKDDKWKAKYKEPAAPEASGLPELPDGWCWAALPQLGELNRGKSKHRPRNDPRLLGGKYPFVQTGDIRNAKTWLRTFEDTYSDFGLAQSRLWPAGTLCITIAANIAETAILGFDACFPDSVVGFLQDDPILTRYVEMFFRTAKRRLDQYAPATAQKNINLDALSKLAVPLPPRNEQLRMVEEFDRLFSVSSAIDDYGSANLRRCVRLRQAVLKWAFEGKLVDQDPTDEPAERLLTRIRTERASLNPLQKGGSRKAQRAA